MRCAHSSRTSPVTSTLDRTSMHIEFMREPGVTLPLHPEAGHVQSMTIWYCKFKSLASLPEYRSLRSLVVSGFPEQTFDIVGELRQLRELRIVHFPQVGELEPIGRLTGLESLSLETLPSWDASGKRQRVASLEPIGRLRGLRSLPGGHPNCPTCGHSNCSTWPG